MSSFIRLHCLAEGETERIFGEKILAPYLARKSIGLSCSLIGKRGGDIRFVRAKNDLRTFLLADAGRYLTLMIDFYGTPKNDWPGLREASTKHTPQAKAEVVNEATAREIATLVNADAVRRFIPYISMHEFEALLFSHPALLAEELGIETSRVEAIVSASPEHINNSPQTAPSKRLEALMPRGKTFKKTITGIAIAEKIGVDPMRRACPLFNQWLQTIETLTGKTS